MEFCPTCGMLLQYALPYMAQPGRFFCPTCPYVCNIESKVRIKRKQRLFKKEIDPIVSKQEEAKLAAETEATCPKCSFKKASFEQHQTRSADEPMTIFYECRNCAHKWKED